MKKYKIYLTSFTILGLFFIVACKKENSTLTKNPTPNLPSQTYSYHNTDDDFATLGRVLFYDKNLSANNSVSCGSCHIQSLAFSDGKQFSNGVANKLTFRNTPGISNESESNGLFWDDRAGSFENLVLKPIVNHEEMGVIDIEGLPNEIQKLSYYETLFFNAYGSNEITVAKIQECLAEFLGALQRPQKSKFEIGNTTLKHSNFNSLELLGKDIFFGKGQCSNCHNLSTNLWVQTANIGLDLNYKDNGMKNGVFRVPNLYNIELTAPYMHDGRFKTLEQVVEHYNSGIKNHPALSWNLRKELINSKGDFLGTEPLKLNLSKLEKQALVSFLKTLTDLEYISDIKYSDPFNF